MCRDWWEIRVLMVLKGSKVQWVCQVNLVPQDQLDLMETGDLTVTLDRKV